MDPSGNELVTELDLAPGRLAAQARPSDSSESPVKGTSRSKERSSAYSFGMELAWMARPFPHSTPVPAPSAECSNPAAELRARLLQTSCWK